MTADQNRRAVFAALLALVYPGLGHLYLRLWGRAMLWFGAVVLTAVLLIPTELFTGVRGFGDALAMWSAVPAEAAIGIALVAMFNVIDAYWTGKQLSFATDELRCPHCGRPVDEDLSFCHWCTSELQMESV